MDVTIDTREHADWMMVSVGGELDLHTSPKLREEVVRLTDEGRRKIAIDLTAIDFIDSSGLGVIVACLKRLRETDGELALVAPDRSPVTKLLSLTGLGDTIPTYPTADSLAPS